MSTPADNGAQGAPEQIQLAQDSLIMESARCLIISLLDGQPESYEANKIRDGLLVHRERAWQLSQKPNSNAEIRAERDRLRDALEKAKEMNRANYDAANAYLGQFDALKSALARAESQFDLLAGYGVPGESPELCFHCMKDIAREARMETTSALAGTAPSETAKLRAENEELRKTCYKVTTWADTYRREVGIGPDEPGPLASDIREAKAVLARTKPAEKGGAS